MRSLRELEPAAALIQDKNKEESSQIYHDHNTESGSKLQVKHKQMLIGGSHLTTLSGGRIVQNSSESKLHGTLGEKVLVEDFGTHLVAYNNSKNQGVIRKIDESPT